MARVCPPPPIGSVVAAAIRECFAENAKPINHKDTKKKEKN